MTKALMMFQATFSTISTEETRPFLQHERRRTGLKRHRERSLDVNEAEAVPSVPR
jgi:hypothetical protein